MQPGVLYSLLVSLIVLSVKLCEVMTPVLFQDALLTPIMNVLQICNLTIVLCSVAHKGCIRADSHQARV